MTDSTGLKSSVVKDVLPRLATAAWGLLGGALVVALFERDGGEVSGVAPGLLSDELGLLPEQLALQEELLGADDAIHHRRYRWTVDNHDAAFAREFLDDEFRGESDLDTWIHRIALNAAIDLMRRRRSRGLFMPDSTSA